MTALVLSIVRLGIVMILAESLYYLGARAEITRFLWSRYPRLLDRFMTCAACVGTWYGSLLALGAGFGLGWDFPGLPGDVWYTSGVVGLLALFTTPILARAHIHALIDLEVGETPALEPTPETPAPRPPPAPAAISPLPPPLPAPDPTPTLPHRTTKP